MAPILGYWDIRGLAEPIRLLLHYTGTEFKDERYECGDAPDYNRDCWFSVKFTLGLDFPNLPYYIDGDIKITQSNAVSTFYNLFASRLSLYTDCSLFSQLMDWRKKFTGLCYNPDFDKLKEGYIKDIKATIQQFSDFLGERKFLAGEKITFVDFILFEVLDEHLLFEASLLDAHVNLKEYRSRIEELTSIAAYRKSEKFKAHPINNKMAKFL
ncbi:unnamed protein product [Porites evermanni]|uniref:glutathione transferase n=1 Tax=Porites evermanni TaxID=104178 RepID=A0ABN8SN53_9CNID|nr:unnamed protein product [Porites evermanni]